MSLESDSSIFEEDLKFASSSGALSFSSMVGDDEPKITDDSKSKERERKVVSEQNLVPYTVDAESCPESMHQVSDGDDDDEDLLVACINIGMQNNRYALISYFKIGFNIRTKQIYY